MNIYEIELAYSVAWGHATGHLTHLTDTNQDGGLPVNEIAVKKAGLDIESANRIIECSRMILLRHLREIDPVTFTSPEFVSYYRLPRGLSIALMGMTPERRSPIDCYMGYVAFKNGLPVAYAGSWVLFDSARIGLNIFPAYRGGESHFIFEQVLKLHRSVYRLKRFSTDPYQIGKNNSDGIGSGAFWTYYYSGFRPLREEQKKIAAAEAKKIKAEKGYRTPAYVLKKLAESRLELIMDPKAVKFDATDISRAYAVILKKKYSNKRKPVEELAAKKLATLLQIKNYTEPHLYFVLKNWSLLLLESETEITHNHKLKIILRNLFELKAGGSEEKYIRELQNSRTIKKIIGTTVNNIAG